MQNVITLHPPNELTTFCVTRVKLLLLNQAYWRSCAALLGQVLETAFKDDFAVELLDTPDVPGTVGPIYTLSSQSIVAVLIFFSFSAVTSGAFCCDVALDPQLDSWSPSEVCMFVL